MKEAGKLKRVRARIKTCGSASTPTVCASWEGSNSHRHGAIIAPFEAPAKGLRRFRDAHQSSTLALPLLQCDLVTSLGGRWRGRVCSQVLACRQPRLLASNVIETDGRTAALRLPGSSLSSLRCGIEKPACAAGSPAGGFPINMG